MILFLEDWAKFPNAIADFRTRNQSFVRLCALYKSMGIKNHLFPLALLQPHLSGIDPFDPTLSDQIRLDIGLEARFNPFYYLRELARLPSRGGDQPNPIEANRGNIALYWLALNHIDVALIQPRQTGKSVNADSLTNWIEYFGARNTNMTLITKDDSLRRANIDRLKEMRDLLPKYLINLSKSDPDNQSEIGYEALNNKFRTAVAQNSEAAALNVGRGMTTAWLQSDEGPFTNYIRVALPAALAAGTAARAEAERNNRPYANIFTTTAGRRDHPDGMFMYNLIHNGAEWNEIFFDAQNRAEAQDMILKAGQGIRTLANVTLSHQQLGKTDEWLYKAIANAGGTREEIERDFFNVWTSGTLASPLSTVLNEAIRASERDPLWVERSKENYMFNWYVSQSDTMELMERPFILGLDTSDAIGRDAIVLVATDVETAEVLGVGRYNETNLWRFANYLLDFMCRYSRSVLIPERRSSAQSIIDFLLQRFPMHGHDPFKRIFNKVVDNAIEQPDAFRELNQPANLRSERFYDERKSVFGLPTTAEIRMSLYGPVLQNAAKRAGSNVRSRSLSREIRGLVVKDGRIDHKAGGHDDAVISWLLTHYLMMYGRNLEYYGIDPSTILRRVVNVGESAAPEDVARRTRKEALAAQIDTLVEQMTDTRDNLVVMKLEYQVRALHSQLQSMGGDQDVVSLDSLLTQSREERRKRMTNDRVKYNISRSV